MLRGHRYESVAVRSRGVRFCGCEVSCRLKSWRENSAWWPSASPQVLSSQRRLSSGCKRGEIRKIFKLWCPDGCALKGSTSARVELRLARPLARAPLLLFSVSALALPQEENRFVALAAYRLQNPASRALRQIFSYSSLLILS